MMDEPPFPDLGGTIGTRLSFDPGKAMKAALGHQRLGQFREAAALLRRVLTADTGNAQALHLLGIIALQTGRAQEAVESIRQAIAIKADDAEFHCNLGIALLTLGREDEGKAALEAALRLKPGHPQARYNLGLLALNAAAFAEARGHLEKTLRKKPDHVDALVALGAALVKENDCAKAIRTLRKALKIVPDHPMARKNLAAALAGEKQFDAAIGEYEKLMEKDPRSADPHFHIGVFHASAGRSKEAMECYERAISLDPRCGNAYINLGNLHHELGKPKKALALLRKAEALDPNNPFLLCNIGQVLLQLGRYDKARETFREVLRISPENRNAKAALVSSYQNEGRFTESKKLFREFEDHFRTDPKLLAVKSQEVDFVPDEEETARMVEMVEDPSVNDEERISLYFALGRILDRKSATEAAHDYFAKGNRLKKTIIKKPFDAAIVMQRTETLKRVFSPELFEKFQTLGSASTRGLFIVGMPRSGTTLVEQILASHLDVEGGGELSDIWEIERDLPDEIADGGRYPECMTALTGSVISRMGERYLRALDEVSTDSRYVTDKMPRNFQRLGLIAILFPKARIIYCRRQPEATALSIFFQDFPEYHDYAYDFHDIGVEYRSHLSLMEHWRKVLPLPMFQLDYEALVADQKKESRRLLAFCGLEWDDRVLEFHKTERIVRTASLWQVRQPLYKSAVDSWRRYEAYLEPFREALAEMSDQGG